MMGDEKSVVVRAGLSPETIKLEGVFRPSDKQLAEYGFNFSGYLIPYYDLKSNQIVDSGKPFYRQRLDQPRGNGQKYHQHRGTRLHLYIPYPIRSKLISYAEKCVIVEGEHKASALCEAGISAVGISGFFGFQEKGGEKLIAELEGLFQKELPKTIFFLGDSDTSHNFLFSIAAVRLARLVGKEILLPRISILRKKGIDDIKSELEPREFLDYWNEIEKNAIRVDGATDPNELSLNLFRREVPNISQLSAGEKKHLFCRISKMATKYRTTANREGLISLALSGGFKRNEIQAAINEYLKSEREEREANLEQFYTEDSDFRIDSFDIGKLPKIEKVPDNLDDIEMPAILVDGLIHMCTKSVFAGPSKVGKTWLLLNFTKQLNIL